MPTYTSPADLDQYRSILVRRVIGLFEMPHVLLVAIGVAMLAIRLLLAYACGILPALLASGQWRVLLVHPVMIIYIICVIQWRS